MKKEYDMSKKCQIFTPKNYVKRLLDSVNYKENIVGKTFLENSCGDGNILMEVVERYILDSKKFDYSNEQIAIGLSNDIYGFEIDSNQYDKCIKNLNNLTNKKGIHGVKWKIYNEDYLKSNLSLGFDFIVGNPPYITYINLQKIEREYIKKTYETCSVGKFDYCYAFIEKSVKSLSVLGKMSYLIPSGIFKTVFGYKLREYIKPYVTEIKDFTLEKIFDNALIKSAILIIDKNKKNSSIIYEDISSKKRIKIQKSKLRDKWIFSDKNNLGKKRFGDYFKVFYSTATLLNEAFIIKKEEYFKNENFYIIDDISLEKKLIRETASPRSYKYKKKEKIIFPYLYEENKLIRFQENEFKKNFPGIVNHLGKFKEKLMKRNYDNGAKWYEYGRSQALSHLNQKKLLLSTVITDKVNVYSLSKNCIPYSGMFVVKLEKNTEYDLDFAKKILQSNDFIKYVNNVGIHISGNSLKITSRDVEEYKI